MIQSSTSGSSRKGCSSPKRPEAYPAFNAIGTGAFIFGVELLGREVDHSLQSSVEVKNEWS